MKKAFIFLFVLFIMENLFSVETSRVSEYIFPMEEGTEIYAVDDGILISRGYDLNDGVFIEIEYPKLGIIVKYCCLSRFKYFFNGKIGKTVKIGETGFSGTIDEPALKLKISINDSFFLKNNGGNDFINEYDPTFDFCLRNKINQKFTLKHSIFEILNFNYAGYEIYKNDSDESEGSRWCIFKQNALSLVWDEKNGNILFMETDSSDFTTERCVNVGDSVVKVLSNYSFDSDVYEYDYSVCNYRLISDKKDNTYVLYSSNDEIKINAVNKENEELMSMHFCIKDGFISKIRISCVD